MNNELKGILNDEMLIKIRQDRPDQVIHEVLDVKENSYGFYNVKVDMETYFFETKIRHCHTTLPYPIAEYEKLSSIEQLEYRWENMV